jgi:hypothetical protein
MCMLSLHTVALILPHIHTNTQAGDADFRENQPMAGFSITHCLLVLQPHSQGLAMHLHPLPQHQAACPPDTMRMITWSLPAMRDSA